MMVEENKHSGGRCDVGNCMHETRILTELCVMETSIQLIYTFMQLYTNMEFI